MLFTAVTKDDVNVRHFSITLSHQGPARRPKRHFPKTFPLGTHKEAEACKAGSHYLHYTQTKWLEHRKNPSPVVTSTPSNVQSRHTPREPHTNWDRNFLCVLPYLNISDSSWLKDYPNRDLQGGWKDIYHGSSFLSKTFPKLTSVVAYLSDYKVTERDCYYEHIVMD